MGILLTPSPGVCRLPGRQGFDVAFKSPIPPGLVVTGDRGLVATGDRGLVATGLVATGVPGRFPAAFLLLPACVYVDAVQHKCF